MKSPGTEELDYDRALVTHALERAAMHGWRGLSVVDAARDAGLALDAARARFPHPSAVLWRLGALADGDALRDAGSGDGSAASGLRDRLFDLLMRRFDTFQASRAGVLAVLRALPLDPGLALLLTAATAGSMRWMLEAAGGDASGFGGVVRVNLVVGAWLYTLRVWQRDDSVDLGATMAALDRALDRLGTLDAAFAPPPAVIEPSVDADAPFEPVIAYDASLRQDR